MAVRFEQGCRSFGRLMILYTTAGLIAAAGCGAGNSLVPAKGKLTVDGKPAEGASILFHPEPTGAGKVSAAAVESDGTFAVSTDGVMGSRQASTSSRLHGPIRM